MAAGKYLVQNIEFLKPIQTYHEFYLSTHNLNLVHDSLVANATAHIKILFSQIK